MGRLAGTVREAPPEDDPGWAPLIVLPGEECDHGGCPSAVQVSITLPGGAVLGFCAHHGRTCFLQMIKLGVKARQPERVGDLKI